MEKFFTDDLIGSIWLDSFKGLEYKYKKALAEKYNLAEIFDEKSEAARYLFETFKICADYEEGVKRAQALKEKGIGAIGYGLEGYPERLKGINRPPLVIYYIGNRKLLTAEHTVGIVGSRKTPEDTLFRTAALAKNLSERAVVVTGIAEGADAEALKGGLTNKNAVCVLAYGMNYSYPSINLSLRRYAEKNGAVITEHPPEVAPKSYLYPERNRIIAGLSDGVVVASAPERSGALITADYAAKYGKEVMAFPYGIGIKPGEGCNNLIKRGAHLVENSQDVCEILGIKGIAEKEEGVSLSEEEEKVYELLKFERMHIDKIMEMTGFSYQKLSPVIMMLEIKGLVRAEAGNEYSAI